MSYPPPSDGNQPPQYGPPPVSPVQPGNAPVQPGYGQPAPIQPVQKSKAGPILLIIGIIVLVVCIGCAVGGFVLFNRASDKVDEIKSSLGVTTGDGSGSHTIRYEVSGTGSVKVTWTDTDGTPHAEPGSSLPWSKDQTLTGDGMALLVSAINTENVDSNLTCTIFVDGKQVKTQSGSTFVLCSQVFVS
jgi:hypothetical protein